LKNANLVLLLLAKIASPANTLAQNRIINSNCIAPDEEKSPDVYRILGEPPACIEVVKRGRKDTAEVDLFIFLAMSRKTDHKQILSEGLVTWVHLSHANIFPMYGAFLEGADGPVSLVSPQMTNGAIVEYTRTISQTKRMSLVCFSLHSFFRP
jgi:hypothetical protein